MSAVSPNWKYIFHEKKKKKIIVASVFRDNKEMELITNFSGLK